jgi:hypothetical protein
VDFDQGSQPYTGWSQQTIARSSAATDFGAPDTPGSHKYTLTIRQPGRPTLTIDPTVDVDDDSPPPEGDNGSPSAPRRKKRAVRKKKAARKGGKKKR